ncbi:MAG: hypothetical protein N2663_07020 [Chlorobi bacterium]|nr:hypothetical protein [Chlorobiota bacterium]
MNRRTVLFTIATLSVVMLVLWQVSNVIRINRLLETIEQKQRVLDSLQGMSRQERIVIARLESAERVCRIAHQKLGLAEPDRPPLVVRMGAK